MENSTTAFKCYHILVIDGSKVEKHYYLLADTPEDALKYAHSAYEKIARFFHCAEVDYQEMRSALVRGEDVFCASCTINAALEKEVARLGDELNAARAAQHSTRNCA